MPSLKVIFDFYRLLSIDYVNLVSGSEIIWELPFAEQPPIFCLEPVKLALVFFIVKGLYPTLALLVNRRISTKKAASKGGEF